MSLITNLNSFALLLHKVLLTDRDILLACAGFTGEGKSAFTSQLLVEYGKISKTDWFYDKMTWSRKEFLGWVEGDKKGKGRVPEYTGILLDELFSMFYSRNWHLDQQKEAIGLLNMCRDRHLNIAGNVPVFWSLDKGFLERVRYYIFIPKRGIAWIFEQEINPFNTDPWNAQENKKAFRKNRSPYKLPNFVAEIKYPDWPKAEKKMYYQIRNQKRIMAQDDITRETTERYGKIKTDRDNLIKAMHLRHNIPQKEIVSIVSLKKSAVSNICLGLN